MFTHTPPIRLMPAMWSLSHTCHVRNQVSSPNRTKKVKKLIKPSNAHLPTSCFSISHSWLLLKENHTSLCVFVAGKKDSPIPFWTSKTPDKHWHPERPCWPHTIFPQVSRIPKVEKKETSQHPQRCRERYGCRSSALSTRFLFLSFRTKEPIWTQPH